MRRDIALISEVLGVGCNEIIHDRADVPVYRTLAHGPWRVK
jgi:hypothetical protein